MVGTSKSLRGSGCNPTKNAPCGNWGVSVVAASIARRVLPLPPRPVTVSRRQSEFRSRAVISPSSFARPTKGMAYPAEYGLIMRVVLDSRHRHSHVLYPLSDMGVGCPVGTWQ